MGTGIHAIWADRNWWCRGKPGAHPAQLLCDVHLLQFLLPQTWNGDEDNVVANRQVVPVPPTVGYTREMQILYAGDWIDGSFSPGVHLGISVEISRSI